MSAKAEYILILLFSIGIPLVSYPFASTYMQKLSFYPEEKSFSFIPHTEAPSEPLSLLFIGDIMLDRTIRLNGETYGYDKLFSCLKDDFANHTAVIGNLEGTVTSYPSVSAGAPYEAPESFRFTFDPQALKPLVNMGLSVVSIGNNHIRDFGDDGISQTLVNTDKLGLVTFGDPRPQGKNYTIETYGNTRIAFIAYNEFFGSEEKTITDLKTAQKDSDLQVIFSHWGDEYVPARSNTKIFAHKLVDNGADLIIGTHPHVIQEKEEYQGAWIYYSLGNFIFDQYWEEAVRMGLAVDVTILDKKITHIKEYDIESKRHEGSCIHSTQ